MQVKMQLLLAACSGLVTLPLMASEGSGELSPHQQAEKTEVWEPVPATIEVPENGVPSDAIMLFDGTNMDAWEAEEGGTALWHLEDGVKIGRAHV